MTDGEKLQSTPENLERERLTGIHAFSIAALGFNGWIWSPGAREDVGLDFHALQQGKEHPSISPLEWRRNLAAMRIMQTLYNSLENTEPFVLLPEIPAADDLYTEVDKTVEKVGLNRLPSYDIKTIGPPIRCFLKDINPTNNIEQAVQQVRINRGVAKQEVTSIDEMVETIENTPDEETLEDLQIMPNGMLAEVHRFPESPTRVVEVPFYQQYVSSSGGAEMYLKAFLKDVMWVSGQLGFSPKQ